MCRYIFNRTRSRKIVVYPEEKDQEIGLLWIMSLKKISRTLNRENLIKFLKYKSTVNSNMNIHNNRLISGNTRSRIKN